LIGTGCHCHISLWKDDKNITTIDFSSYDPKKREVNPLKKDSLNSYFIAGLLKSMGAVMSFTVASNNSFKRLAPHTWAGDF